MLGKGFHCGFRKCYKLSASAKRMKKLMPLLDQTSDPPLLSLMLASTRCISEGIKFK